MTNFLVFAILGLGAGVAYLALAFGVVVVYKGSGVLNFAQGGIAMFGAYVYSDLTGTGSGQQGWSPYVALVLVLIAASLFGAVLYFAVMKHLRHAPALAKVVATLGVLAALQGFATLHWGAVDESTVRSLFPIHPVSIGGGAQVGVDRFYALALAGLITVGLWWLYGRTRFGLATRGVAESEKGASLLGYSPDFVASLNWALGCALAALAGIIIAPVAGLDTATLPLMILPAFAAALLGRFRSFTVTAVVALAIGIAQSELTLYWSSQPGVNVAVPLAVVIVAMIISGRLIPQRGALSEGRPPKTPSGRIRPLPAGLAIAATVALLVFGNPTYQAATVTSLGFAIAALSLVVITGYTGQISIAQMTFAGLSGLFLAKLATHLGVPFPLSVLVAALLAVPVGVLVGLPALRVRGINLAVVTFGLAYAVTSVVFQNTAWTGAGLIGTATAIPSPSIAGLSLDGFAHPQRLGLFTLIVLVLTVVLVSNLRSSGSGRKLLAVRSNERAAAAAGVRVARTKLQAFALAAFIAGLAGAMMSTAINQVTFTQFTASASISLITITYIGGIASIAGALFAGAGVAGGVSYILLSHVPGYSNYFLPVSGILLVLTVLFQPDGVAPLMQDNWRAMLAKRAARRGREVPEVGGA